MLNAILILFVAVVVYSLLKGELDYVRDNLEIQLRQTRFRLDRLERRVRELEAENPNLAPQSGMEPAAPAEPGTLTSPAP